MRIFLILRFFPQKASDPDFIARMAIKDEQYWLILSHMTRTYHLVVNISVFEIRGTWVFTLILYGSLGELPNLLVYPVGEMV